MIYSVFWRVIMHVPRFDHNLQPLDDVAFGLFRMELGRKHEDLSFSSAALFDQDGGLDQQHVIDAGSKVFSPKTIRRSWINTDMAHPDDHTRIEGEKIMRRARETFGLPKLKVVTLVDKSAQQATRVIRSAQCPPSKKAVKIPVETGRMYQANELRVLHQKQQAQQAEKAAQKRQKAQQRAEKAQARVRAREEKRILKET